MGQRLDGPSLLALTAALRLARSLSCSIDGGSLRALAQAVRVELAAERVVVARCAAPGATSPDPSPAGGLWPDGVLAQAPDPATSPAAVQPPCGWRSAPVGEGDTVMVVAAWHSPRRPIDATSSAVLEVAAMLAARLGRDTSADAAERLRRRVEERAARLNLTPSEQAAAVRVALGRSNKEIAAALGVSLNTVKDRLAAIYRKTGCAGRDRLAALLLGARSR